MIIESSSNAFVKYVKKLKDKKYRKIENKYIIEGTNLCKECMEHMPHIIDSVVVTPENTHLAQGFSPVYTVTEKIFSMLADTENPQGILIVGKTETEQFIVSDFSCVVYLDRVKDPGNVGTIVRTADAFGADAVVLSADCADLYNPKTVRATMGSMFHIPVVCEQTYLDFIHTAKQNNFTVVTGSLDATHTPAQTDFTQKTVICLGNEAHGVSEELVALGVSKVKIPMPGKAESLNVAIAGAVLLYEAVRQKGESA